MFRESKASKPDPEHFGVGSLIKGTRDYLVTLQYESNSGFYVGLLSLKDYKTSTENIRVEDPNHMTSLEVKNLIRLIENPEDSSNGFTDFDYISEGISYDHVSKKQG